MQKRLEGRQSSRLVEPIEKPEIVIGLVGPIGTDLDALSNTLDETLSDVGYLSKNIKVTSLFREFENADFQLPEAPLSLLRNRVLWLRFSAQNNRAAFDKFRLR
jgi:hypothetical protein